jgi:trehalose 6-phosphate synthase/phosphatase
VISVICPALPSITGGNANSHLLSAEACQYPAGDEWDRGCSERQVRGGGKMSYYNPEKGRLIIVSNRLPFNVSLDSGEITFHESAGGLATGLSTFLDSYKSHLPSHEQHVWLGWPGSTIPGKLKPKVRARAMQECNARPVFLSAEEMENFYRGFCNKTLWPLFHYFPTYVAYDEEFWQTYRCVNERFRDALLELLKPDDIVWVHDYHLMLLPRLLRERNPDIMIGFFLHIPFPSFELFRLLPPQWRHDLLEGVLGSDLVGFHTYEYMQHFSQSVLRFLGRENRMGLFTIGNHLVKAETYPMGIDFHRYHEASTSPETAKEQAVFKDKLAGFNTVLSIDRLDYSKGIRNRLEGFEYFLEHYPEYREKLVLIMVVVPSRIGVMQYEDMKKQIEEMVGKINGKFGTIGWTPVIYQYRNLSLHPLSALYSMSDVALVTPLRDGMNLIAKEYIASRPDRSGVLILSEMTGAVKELGEAIIVNPNDIRGIAAALDEALKMPPEEQQRRNAIMQERLRRYDVTRWAGDFIGQLTQMRDIRQKSNANLLPPSVRKKMAADYSRARRRLLLIDYDGTLIPYETRPDRAAPDEKVLNLLRLLATDRRNTLVLASGRDQATMEKWFGSIPVNIIAEHGMWLKESGAEWFFLGPDNDSWKESLNPVLHQYSDRLPGSLVEEKDYSIAWHYRTADPEQSNQIVTELIDNLMHFTANMDIQLLRGNKVLEIRTAGVNKTRTTEYWTSGKTYDFTLAIGDDWTDEDLFQVLPRDAYTIRVGIEQTLARYNVRHSEDVHQLLHDLIGRKKSSGTGTASG